MPEATSTSPDTDAIELSGLSHAYPGAERAALDDVSFSIRPGACFGVLGPNGSGKSTLFKILSTMLAPRPTVGTGRGSVMIMGSDVVNDPAQARQRLGVVFQSPSLDGKLTAEENLRYHGRMYGIPRKALEERIDHWLSFFGLTDRRSEFVERFSGGMRRKLEVAKALLHQPDLLLMDEPATGLDPAARLSLWDQLNQLRSETGMTIVFTTHLMDEADRCDRLAIMNAGKLVVVDTPDALKAQIGGDVITLEPDPGEDLGAMAEQINDRFGPWDNGAAPVMLDGKVQFEKPEGARMIADVAAAFPGQIRALTVGRPTLEDVFIHLTGASLNVET